MAQTCKLETNANFLHVGDCQQAHRRQAALRLRIRIQASIAQGANARAVRMLQMAGTIVAGRRYCSLEHHAELLKTSEEVLRGRGWPFTSPTQCYCCGCDLESMQRRSPAAKVDWKRCQKILESHKAKEQSLPMQEHIAKL